MTLHSKGWRRVAKRAMDIVGSVVGLIFLYTSDGLRFDSGPTGISWTCLLRSGACGLDARPFAIIKFRSMRANAEGRPGWTTSGDPRRTKVGNLLRKLNIDELPQLINVLIGE